MVSNVPVATIVAPREVALNAYEKATDLRIVADLAASDKTLIREGLVRIGKAGVFIRGISSRGFEFSVPVGPAVSGMCADVSPSPVWICLSRNGAQKNQRAESGAKAPNATPHNTNPPYTTNQQNYAQLILIPLEDLEYAPTTEQGQIPSTCADRATLCRRKIAPKCGELCLNGQ